MATPVVHWEINARDSRKLHEFYSTLFGWKIDTSYPMNYGMVGAEKKGIGGGIGQTDPNLPAPSLTFYVQVEDLQGCLDRAASLGGRTVMPVKEIPGMVTFALFADPEGNVVGILKGPAQEPKKAAPRKKKAARKKKATRKKTTRRKVVKRRR